ncbi:MAG TPA: DNA-binding response regulator, partial [Ruminococcaceae bacterium]|nr:DNA-binding response regulator [Oscillospiraceae bacterium]
YRRTWGTEAGDWEHIVSVNISRLRKHLGLNEGSAFEISCTQNKDYILRKTRFT